MRAPAARGEILLAGALLSLAVLLLDALFFPRTLEDAFITFRYAEHLAEGFGLGAWNTTGERVEGYTSTLWMLWLALAPRLGLSIETLAKLTGIAAHLALVWVFLAVPLRARADLLPAAPAAERDLFLLSAVLLALSLPLAWYASSGMETVPFALLVGVALLAPGLSAGPGLPIAAAALLVGMRPEGALFALALGAAHFLRARALGAPRGPALAGLAAAVVGLAGLSLLRLAVFGELVPNTWFAKVAGAGTLFLGLGFAYLVDWLLANAAFALAVAAAAAVCAASLLRRRADLGSPLAVLLGLAVVFAAYVVRAGGDNTSAFPYWRHLLHAAPLLAFLAATGLVGVAPRSRTLRAALAAALVATSTASTLGVHGDRLRREVREDLRRFPHLAHRPPSAYDRWLARLASPDTVIASSAAGEMPFVVDAVHLDMLGLNDRHIAHEGRFDPRGPVDSKSDPAYVLGRRPDVLQLPVVVSKILEAEGDRAPVLRRGQMSWAIVRDPRFRDEYLLVRNAPYSHRDVALFVRRGWWQTHPRKDELQVVPFAETGLYRRWIAGGSGGDVTDPRRPR